MSSPIPDVDPAAGFIPHHPFANNSNGDTILRSSDGAEFYVQRGILSLVSPVFETMFALPGPQPDPAQSMPIIDIHEDARTIDRALRFFYPGTQPTVATLNELQETIEILVGKYDMQSIVPMAKTHLQEYLESQPLAVYAVAFAQRWEDVGRDAAKECLKLPLRIPDPEVPRELRHLTSTAYHNLLLYHFQCAEAVKQTTKDLKWIQNPARYCWFICGSCAAHGSVLLSDGTAPSVRSWFMQFLNGMGEQLALKPIRSLYGHPLFFDAIRVAVYCNGHCRARALDDLNSFITVWEAKITEEIAKVGGETLPATSTHTKF